jgi:hypothetical protein
LRMESACSLSSTQRIVFLGRIFHQFHFSIAGQSKAADGTIFF